MLSIEEARSVVKDGVAEGYNACCIKNYLNLLNLGYYPAVFMAAALGHNHILGHVLCPICYDKFDKKHPNRNKYDMKAYFGKGPEVDTIFANLGKM